MPEQRSKGKAQVDSTGDIAYYQVCILYNIQCIITYSSDKLLLRNGNSSSNNSNINSEKTAKADQSTGIL